MTEFKVGDKVTFQNCEKDGSVPKFYCEGDGIDGALIRHGSTRWDKKPAEVIGLSAGYVVVRFSSGSQEMQLGFKGEDLIHFKKHNPKDPSHIVVWNEQDKDPHQFFTSEPDAKKFVKELSDKSEVVKDSIIFAEIKSARRVNITKNVRLKNYKI